MTINAFLLKPKTKAKIKTHWKSLSSTAQALIASIVLESQNYEHKAFKKAISYNPNFIKNFQQQLASSQRKCLHKLESQENQKPDKLLNQALSKL